MSGWAYDPSRPQPERFQWVDDEPTWPTQPQPTRLRLRRDPAAETARVAAAFTAGLAALIRGALDELDRLDREDM